MTEQTPAPEDPGGSPGGLGAQPGYPAQSGFTAQPGCAEQPGHGTQPGYGAAPGSPGPPGYGAPPAYGTPGYAQPGPGGVYPPPPRSRARLWLAFIAGIVVLGVIIAGVSVYLLTKSKRWVLTTPQTVAGLHRDTSSLDQAGFSRAVAKFKSDVTSLHNYGHLNSTVSALYTQGSGRAVGFVGFNGTFNVQVVLKSANDLKVTAVNAGPHGGVAECGTSSAETICQWSTASTVGIVVIVPANGSSGAESARAAGNLMLRIRNAAERPAHGS